MDIIKEDYIDIAKGIDRYYLRDIVGMSNKKFNSVLKGKTSITIDTAESIFYMIEDEAKRITGDSRLKLKFENVFYIENLKGGHSIFERAVEYIYSSNSLTKKEMADFVRDVFNYKFKGHMIFIIITLTLIISIIWLIIYLITNPNIEFFK